MQELLQQIVLCLERGKVDAQAAYPADMAGQEGVDELTRRALADGVPAEAVLDMALIVGMDRVGVRFRDGEIFLPDVLLAARAMTAGMARLEPYFRSGEVAHKGTVLMGTVAGDLHDIGKKVVSMFFKGGGWKVVDLGVDAGADSFMEAIEEHDPAAAGLSALLTTTMPGMEDITRRIRIACPDVHVIVGGAPITRKFADRIGAQAYSPDPQGALDYLNRHCAR